jgi:hypothetical protein
MRIKYHKVTPKGAHYKNIELIKDDINHNYYNSNYRVREVHTTQIPGVKAYLFFSPNQNNWLNPYFDSYLYDELVIYIDYYNNSTSTLKGEKELTKESIKITNFLLERKLDEKIKAIVIFYVKSQGFLGVPQDRYNVVVLDQYKLLIRKYKKLGLSQNDINEKLYLYVLEDNKKEDYSEE